MNKSDKHKTRALQGRGLIDTDHPYEVVDATFGVQRLISRFATIGEARAFEAGTSGTLRIYQWQWVNRRWRRVEVG